MPRALLRIVSLGLVAMVLILSACGGGGETTTPATNTPVATLPTATITPTVTQEDSIFEVILERGAYLPAEITVPVGTTVKWIVPADGERHGIMSWPSGPINAGAVDPGQSYSHSFTEAGVYDYSCLAHEMYAKVIVE